MSSPSVTTFTDRCLACHSLFQSTWGDRSGYCSSSCILASFVIREGAYISPNYRGNRVWFIIQTRENPTRENDWIAFTNTPAYLIRPQLGVYEGAGQFAGSGESEIDAVLDLISEIEALS